MTYKINHRDIKINSEKPLSWKQVNINDYEYDNLSINEELYNDYKPTNLMFKFTSADIEQEIEVSIPYYNRLERIYANHAIVCKLNEENEEWEEIYHQLNSVNKTIEFNTNSVGVYGVFINHYWYTDITQRMADEYPNWTEIKNNTDSVGQMFLNYFGIELEVVKDYLLWISEQKYIGTSDLHMLDWIYSYQLPKIERIDELKFFQRKDSTMKEIRVLENLRQFFYNDHNDGLIIDYDENKAYTSIPYGNIDLFIVRDGKTTQHKVVPLDHHIWNTFDEFGLLVGIRRMHLEDNYTYKERILDVFRYPSGTHDMGLTNGIARDLKLISREDKKGNELVWENDFKDLLLKNTSGKVIDERSLRIDDQPLEQEDYFVNEVGDIRIYAKKEGLIRKVSFIYGVDKYELYDSSDLKLHKMKKESDGQATPKLLGWVEYINSIAPIMWDRFNWDEGFWDTIDKDLTGLGYVPNIWDSNIDVWKDYTFESDM